MSKPTDDLDAVRTVVAALEGFDANEQERIVRWAREKLGLPIHQGSGSDSQSGRESADESRQGSASSTSNQERADASRPKDIKSFVAVKNPRTDNQFTATVAYYYRFEAPPADRKEAISADDLQEACRKVGRDRLARPAQTLVNAHMQGYLDKGPDRGAYVLNTVGENLVAMTLPEGEGGSPGKRRTSAKKKAKKK